MQWNKHLICHHCDTGAFSPSRLNVYRREKLRNNFYLFQFDGIDDNNENPEQVLLECAEKFATPDYIMEPGIFSQLKR